MTSLRDKEIKTAQRFLSTTDPVMKSLIKSTPFTLTPNSDQSPFEALTRAIASQQLHGTAAEAILRRFIALVPGKAFPEPDDVAVLPEEQIRSSGFSKSKISAL